MLSPRLFDRALVLEVGAGTGANVYGPSVAQLLLVDPDGPAGTATG